MLNKIIKLSQIILIGAMLFGFIPFVGFAYSPYVSTGSATGITSNNVTFNGSVNADNMPTSVWFEYSTNSNLSNSFSVTASRFTSGNSGNLIANASGLYPNTTYYFRAVAQNAEGRAYGNIYLFTTNYNYDYQNYPFANDIYINNTPSPLPHVITNPATSVGTRSAKLNSLIANDAGNPFSTYFEWGNSPSLGNQTPYISVGYLASAKHISTITGLAPGTTYYFRAVAENGAGKLIGSTLSFTTNNVAIQASAVEKNTNDPAITNTDTIQPVDSSLGANALSSGSFFPMTILGWLLFIILILVLILVSKHLYRNFLEKKPESTQKHA